MKPYQSNVKTKWTTTDVIIVTAYPAWEGRGTFPMTRLQGGTKILFLLLKTD